MGAETEFEKLLEKNENYKNLVDKYESHVTDDKNTSKGFDQLGSAVDSYIKERTQPKVPSHAELQAEAEMDMANCSTCQGYLNLSGDINKVLSKMEIGRSDIPTFNESKLQLNHLKYLYYVVKYDQTEGSTRCNKYGNLEKINSEFKGAGSYKLMAEEVFDLPNVNEVQYITENESEIIYLYRGVGSDSNKVFEVHIRPDGKGLIRYYDYTPSSAERKALQDAETLKRIVSLTEKKQEAPKDNFIDLGADLKTRDKFIPTDLEVVKAGTKTEISDELVLGTKTKVSFNEQVTELNLANNSGENYFIINAKNKTEGKSEFVTILPMTVNIDKDSKLNLNGSLKQEVGIVHGEGVTDRAQTVNLNLTDHNHKYIEVEFYQKPTTDYSKVTLSNKYSLGDNNSIGMNFSQDNDGKRSYSVGQNTNLGDYGTLKTEFGSATSGKRFVSLEHEVAIGKASTLSIGARAEDGNQYSTMLQFKSRF